MAEPYNPDEENESYIIHNMENDEWETGENSESKKWNRIEIEGLFCSICMDAWTCDGDHQICCLPCGHLYGLSCISKWLKQKRSSGQCPQCNMKCSLKDVRKLFAPRIAAVDNGSQKMIPSLEVKCSLLEKKNADLMMWNRDSSIKESELRKKNGELRKNNAELQDRVKQLTEERRQVEEKVDQLNFICENQASKILCLTNKLLKLRKSCFQNFILKH